MVIKILTNFEIKMHNVVVVEIADTPVIIIIIIISTTTTPANANKNANRNVGTNPHMLIFNCVGDQLHIIGETFIVT